MMIIIIIVITVCKTSPHRGRNGLRPKEGHLDSYYINHCCHSRDRLSWISSTFAGSSQHNRCQRYNQKFNA